MLSFAKIVHMLTEISKLQKKEKKGEHKSVTKCMYSKHGNSKY